MSVIIRKTVPEDFEAILPLLEKFPLPYIKRRHWEKLFEISQSVPEAFPGFIMEDSGNAVGFLGLIFGRRSWNGKTIKTVNTTSWIVLQAYRGRSVFMLTKLLKIQDAVFTDLTPSKEVYSLISRVGFKEFETHNRLFFSLPLPVRNKNRIERITNKEDAQVCLTEDQFALFSDHQQQFCRHLILKAEKGNCYIIITRMVRRKMPFIFGQVQYISHPEVFRSILPEAGGMICRAAGVPVLGVWERYLKGMKIFMSVRRPLPFPMMYYGPKEFENNLDTLYSESVVLNI